MKDEIDSLKSQTAKKNRVEKILFAMDIAKKELEDNCQECEEYRVAINAIHNVSRETMVLKVADTIK